GPCLRSQAYLGAWRAPPQPRQRPRSTGSSRRMERCTAQASCWGSGLGVRGPRSINRLPWTTRRARSPHTWPLIGDRSLRTNFGPMRLRSLLFSATVFCGLFHAQAQLGVTTFGLQAKPVIPFGFFGPLTTVQQEHLTGSLELNGGLAFGMTVRTGISKSISLEAGIAQITRRYHFGIANDTSGYTDSGA